MRPVALLIEKLLESGLSYRDVAKRVGCSAQYVSNIHKRGADPSCEVILGLIDAADDRAVEMERMAEEMRTMTKSKRD